MFGSVLRHSKGGCLRRSVGRKALRFYKNQKCVLEPSDRHSKTWGGLTQLTPPHTWCNWRHLLLHPKVLTRSTHSSCYPWNFGIRRGSRNALPHRCQSLTVLQRLQITAVAKFHFFQSVFFCYPYLPHYLNTMLDHRLGLGMHNLIHGFSLFI